MTNSGDPIETKCDCSYCRNPTALGVCHKEAIKANWDAIKDMIRPEKHNETRDHYTFDELRAFGCPNDLLMQYFFCTKKEIDQPMEEKEYLLQFFEYNHLPLHLQDFSKPFHDLAHELCKMLPKNPERTTALRKLLEAKDCAVRAHIFK